MIKFNKTSFILNILILIIYLPIFHKHLPPYIGSVHLWTLLWFLIVVIEKKILNRNRFMFLLLVISASFIIGINTVWSGINRWSEDALVAELYQMILAGTLIFYFNSISTVEFGKKTFQILKYLIFTAITTSIILLVYPTAVRHSYGGKYLPGEKSFFNLLGGGSHDFIQSMVMLIPLIVYLIRMKSVSKLFGYSILALFMFTIINAQIFANILLSVIVLFFSINGSSNFKRNFIFFVLFLSLVVVIPQNYYSNGLSRVSGLFEENSIISNKLMDFSVYMEGGAELDGETSMANRAARYPLLLEVFSESPLLGGFFESSEVTWEAGAHLGWMYRLASFGLIGFLMTMAVHIYFIKTSLIAFRKDYIFYFLLSCFSLIGLNFIKAFAGRQVWVTYFVLTHGFYYIPEYINYKQSTFVNKKLFEKD